MKKFISIFFITLLIITALSIPIYGGTNGVKFQSNNNNAGAVYWLCSNKGHYVFEDYSNERYSENCLISYGTQYSPSLLDNCAFVVKPDSSHYLNNFSDGEKTIELKSQDYNILSVNVSGVKYYDYYLSHNASINQYLTISEYNKLVKEYVKTLYGTTSYKVIGTFTAYYPGKNHLIKVHFKEKKNPEHSLPNKINAYVKDNVLDNLVNKTGGLETNYKSSNTKVCVIDKNTGEITIKNEGISTITCTIKGTERIKEKIVKIPVKIYPPKVSIKKISTSKGSIKLSWGNDLNASGYNIWISKKSNFSKKSKYTVNSSKTINRIIKSLSSNKKYYVKVRAYKKSCNEYIYGSWSSVKSIKVR